MTDYIKARNSLLNFYRDIPLYKRIDEERFTLYKPRGVQLGEMRIQEERHPEELYIRQSDKLRGIQEAQRVFNGRLKSDIEAGRFSRMKETLVTIVEETLSEPRSGSLEGVAETVNILVNSYSKDIGVIGKLIDLSSADYSTVLHSINVMAFSLAFASYHRYSHAEARSLGLSGLLHDVGKTKIDRDILVAPRKLSLEEFEEMKRHTTIGYDILQRCEFKDTDIGLVALEHHEKLDGSGYPGGKTGISEKSQIIGLIDCYEALTNDDRPYRDAMQAFDTLNKIIKKDVEAGKFSTDLFRRFVKSLGSAIV